MKASVKTQACILWKEHSDAWKTSGISQRAYCEREDIRYRSFVYHHNRLMSQSKKTLLNFIETKPESGAISNQVSGLQLLLPNGIRIGIGSDINPDLLQKVLSVAGAFQCLS